MNYLQNILSNQLTQLELCAASNRPSFPPVDIIKNDEFTYQIKVALAGYKKDEVIVTHSDNVLQIERMVKTDDTVVDKNHYVHKGIAKRNFRLKFPVSKHMVVKDAIMVDGLLVINLELIVPEELKPRNIPIL